MSIFEGDDEALGAAGGVSELSGDSAHDLRLDPLRGALGSLHDETGARVGTISTEVEVWYGRSGVVVRRAVDPHEVVRVEVVFDPVPLDDDGYPVVLPWVETWLESDDETLAALLEGRLLYPERVELTVSWFDAVQASRERAQLRSD